MVLIRIETIIFVTITIFGGRWAKTEKAAKAEVTGCVGGDADGLPRGCTKIEGKPLVFRAGQMHSLLLSQLVNVRSIQAGVEVIGTDIEKFAYLDGVETIENPTGPALLFRQNKKLKSIVLSNLVTLSGSPQDIIFDRDGFPEHAVTNPNALSELLHLEERGRTTHGNPLKCQQFVTVAKPPKPSYIFLIIGSVVCLAAVVATGYTGWYIWTSERKAKKGIRSEAEDTERSLKKEKESPKNK